MLTGMSSTLVHELEEDVAGYKKYMRMSKEHFNDLLDKISPLIERQNTNFHDAISPTERLAVTLRFLATGMMNSLNPILIFEHFHLYSERH